MNLPPWTCSGALEKLMELFRGNPIFVKGTMVELKDFSSMKDSQMATQGRGTWLKTDEVDFEERLGDEGGLKTLPSLLWLNPYCHH